MGHNAGHALAKQLVLLADETNELASVSVRSQNVSGGAAYKIFRSASGSSGSTTHVWPGALEGDGRARCSADTPIERTT